MPSYKWLINNKHDRSDIKAKLRGMVSIGVPYTEEDIDRAEEWMNEQAKQIEQNLYNDPDFVAAYEADKEYSEENGLEFVEMKDREVVALIAYLQRLGTDIKLKEVELSKSEE